MTRTRLVILLASGVLSGCEEDRRPAPATGGGEAAASDTLTLEERRRIPGEIAFVSERDGNREVYLVRPSGEGMRRLTNEPTDDYPAPAAPDGSALLVVSVRETETEHVEQLKLLPLDGGAPTPLGRATSRARNPSWAPDGSWVAYETDVDAFREVYRVARDGGAVRRLTHAREGNFEPAVSPDGRRIAFVSSRDGNAQLYVAAADGSGARRVTAFHRDDWAPHWSPDGRTLAFLSHRIGGVDRIHLVDADGRNLRPLDAAPAVSPASDRGAGGDAERIEEGIAWAPDGKRIAYVTRTRDGETAIRVADLVTGERRRIVGGAPGEGRNDMPAWSPDGRHLVFVSYRDGNPELYLARADGSRQTRLTKVAAADWLPRWVPPRRGQNTTVTSLEQVEVPASQRR